MSFSETAALKYAISKTSAWTYPRETLYHLVVSAARLSDVAFSIRTVDSVDGLLRRLTASPQTPVTRILLRDLTLVRVALDAIDPGYDPKRLPRSIDAVIGFLERELKAKAPLRLKLSVVEKYPAPYQEVKASAWALGEFESNMIGMPAGVYMRRDQLFPVAAECILAHEYAHTVIVDLPNYVPWFDEGFADILGYVYYVRRCGRVEDLPAWINYRSELKQYGHWYAEYDRLVAALLTTCGLDFVRNLVKLKRNEPERVGWTRLAEVLRSNPSYAAIRRCVKGPVPEYKPLPRDYLAISTLFSTPSTAYTISAEGFAVMVNLMEAGGKAEDAVAFRGIGRALRRAAEGDLRDHNLVYRKGKELAVYGGPVLGSDQLFSSNLVRARIPKELVEGILHG
jgi:hypothetical protein